MVKYFLDDHRVINKGDHFDGAVAFTARFDVNLDKVPEAGALITVGFAKPEGGTGGYARCIAIAPADWNYGQSVLEAPGTPLPKQPHPLRRDENGVPYLPIRNNPDLILI